VTSELDRGVAFVRSETAKADVLPIEKPARHAKPRRHLERKTPLKAADGALKRTPLGHCTPLQKARVSGQTCIVCGSWFDKCEAAHVIPRGHSKMSPVAADDPRAVVPLCPWDHRLYDEGKIDLLPHLEPAWREAQEWAAGAVGLATALRVITGEAA
jgi:hypothetical protein